MFVEELNIHIDVDKEAGTITIRDNSIGMNQDEVMENIGTIANSGTRKYLESLDKNQAQDSNLIGQFGVGFYPDRNIDVYDRYFFHKDQEFVERFYGRKIPSPQEFMLGLKLFGITYDSKGNIKKLKRYVFPQDPSINFPEKLCMNVFKNQSH